MQELLAIFVEFGFTRISFLSDFVTCADVKERKVIYAGSVSVLKVSSAILLNILCRGFEWF